jgi:methylmalonyl-CoA epimerase (EC 5.1.99.1)
MLKKSCLDFIKNFIDEQCSQKKLLSRKLESFILHNFIKTFNSFAKQPNKQLHLLKIEHIGIAVHSLEDAIPLYEKLLNTECYKTELVESEQVMTAFFESGPNKIELLASTTPDGIIQRFIDKKGEGIHHIAFAVEDIYAEMERLRSQGFVLLHEKPKEGADNKLICFLHPKHTHGVLIELCMDKANTDESL